MLTPARVLLALSASALIISATPVIAHAAPAPDVVHAQVAAGSQTDPHHGYYVLQAKPGASITQQVVVSNPNDHAVVADVTGVDAWTSDATGVSYGTPRSTPKSTGAWITIVTPQLQLAPLASRTIPFTVSVPRDAGAGQYLAAVSISVPGPASPVSAPASGNKAAFAVTLQTQRVIAVEVDVPGPSAPHLAVRAVRPVVQANALRLQFDVANTGNAFAKGQGSLIVADTNTRRDFKIATFVSHTSIKLALAWTKNVVPGVHQVTLRLQDQTGRVVNWTGSVDVTGAAGASLERTLAAAKDAKLHHGGGTSLQWLALLLVPVCIAAAVHLRRRRSSSAPNRPSGPAARRGGRGATATPPRPHEDPVPSPTKVEAGTSR